MAKLSICIPTRNRAAELARHLSHIASFERLDYEVVISDNASDDDTKAVVERWAPRLTSVHYVRQKQALTFYETQIAACNLAAGEYAMCPSDDDLVVEDGLLRAIAVLDKDATIAAVYGAWEEIREGAESQIRGVPHGSRIDAALVLSMFASLSTLELPIFRTAAFRRAHLPIRNQLAFDFHGAALLARSGDIMLIPDIVIQVMVHAGQNSAKMYVPEFLGCYLADYELLIGQYGNIDEHSAMLMIGNAMSKQYVAGAIKALAQGRFVTAHELLTRANVYCGGKSSAAIAEFEDTYAMHMAAESLHGFIETCPPVARILIEGDAAGQTLAPLLKARVGGTPIEVIAGADWPAQDIGETDFLIYGDPAILAAAQAASPFVIRRQRRLGDILGAVTSADRAPFKLDAAALQRSLDQIAA